MGDSNNNLMRASEIDSYLDEAMEDIGKSSKEADRDRSPPGAGFDEEVSNALQSMIKDSAPARPKRKKKGKSDATASMDFVPVTDDEQQETAISEVTVNHTKKAPVNPEFPLSLVEAKVINDKRQAADISEVTINHTKEAPTDLEFLPSIVEVKEIDEDQRMSGSSFSHDALLLEDLKRSNSSDLNSFEYVMESGKEVCGSSNLSDYSNVDSLSCSKSITGAGVDCFVTNGTTSEVSFEFKDDPFSSNAPSFKESLFSDDLNDSTLVTETFSTETFLPSEANILDENIACSLDGAISSETLVLDECQPEEHFMTEQQMNIEEKEQLDEMMESNFGFSHELDLDRDDVIVKIGENERNISNPFIFTDTSIPSITSNLTDVPEFSSPIEQFEDVGESFNSESFLSISINNTGLEYDECNAPSPSLRRHLSSSALANQLYSRGVSREPSIESASVHGLSMEEIDGTVNELTERIKELEKVVDELKEENEQSKAKTESLKLEHQNLLEKMYEVDDQMRINEDKAKAKAMEDERFFKETYSKLEKQKKQDVEQLADQNQQLIVEGDTLKSQVQQLQKEFDAICLEKLQSDDQLLEKQRALEELQAEYMGLKDEFEAVQISLDDEKTKNREILEEVEKELDDLKTFHSDAQPLMKMRSTSYANLPSKVDDLEQELRTLKNENTELKESREELQVQLISFGRDEVERSWSQGKPDETSLSTEMEAASREELCRIVQQEKDINKHLKQYVDKIILVILENQPELLEVVATMEVKTTS